MQSMVRKWAPAFCLVLGGVVAGQVVAQTAPDGSAPGTTHKERKAMKAQDKADRKAAIAQAKADKTATKAQGEANDKAAEARLDSAKKQ